MFLNSFESIALFHLYGWGVLIKSIKAEILVLTIEKVAKKPARLLFTAPYYLAHFEVWFLLVH